MRNLISLAAEKILAVNSPEALFSQSVREAKQEYRTLALRWHPDHERSPLAPRVFAHVVQLYQIACEKLSNGQWIEPGEKIEDEITGVKRFRMADRSIRSLEYRIARPFELGCMYIADHSVIFEVNNDFQDLFEQGRKRIHLLTYKNDAMTLEMSKYLPQVKETFKTESANVLVVRKTPDQLLLSDVLKHFAGKLTPSQHSGWILNLLFNLGCYLEWASITHNAIAPETFFISPLRHTGMLLGGWWYSTKVGERLLAVPDRSLNFIPPDILRNKRASVRADLELIKSVGREILGEPSDSLVLQKSLPSILVNFLLMPSSGKAADDYLTFKREVLPQAFGPPKFVTMHLDINQLYKEI